MKNRGVKEAFTEATRVALAANGTHEHIAAGGGPEAAATAHALREDGVRILARGDDRTAIGDDDIAARTIARGVVLTKKIPRQGCVRGRFTSPSNRLNRRGRQVAERRRRSRAV